MRCVAISLPLYKAPPMLAGMIGANIKAARKGKGWSLEKLAARIDPPTSYQQVSRLEQGRMLTIDWIEKIAKALSVDPLTLLGGGTQESRPLAEGMSEQVSAEVARVVAQVALQGKEPEPGTVEALTLILKELSATFARHPQAYRDPAIALPVVDLAARRFGRA
jgi:transcriptional regulator with XRE-family HTH domain